MATERFYIVNPPVPLTAFILSQILLITVYVKNVDVFPDHINCKHEQVEKKKTKPNPTKTHKNTPQPPDTSFYSPALI